jgi:hypothetical protein
LTVFSPHGNAQATVEPKMKSGPVSPALTVLYNSRDLVLGELGNTCIAIWRAKPTLPTFQVQRAELARIVNSSPGQAALLCVVAAECEPPEEPVRKASSEMISTHGPLLRKVAGVIEGRGFKAAITRSVLSGMQLIVRSPVEIKFFRTPFDGALWLDVDAQRARDVVRALEVLRTEPLGNIVRRVAAGA